MMKYEPTMPTAVDMAYEVVNMDRELQRLRAQVADLEEYKQRYHELLSESIDHGRHMIGGLLDLALTPGVLDACAASNARATQGAPTNGK
jgi:hypothetical protein